MEGVFLKTSRIYRFTRFLETASPSFFDMEIPSLEMPKEFLLTIN